MKAVILDAATLGDDIDLTPLHEAVDTLEVHAHTAREERQARLPAPPWRSPTRSSSMPN